MNKGIIFSALFLLGLVCFQSTSFANLNSNKDYIKSFSKPTVVTIDNEQNYMYLGGKNGLFLCFHGRDGRATGWKKIEKKEYLDYFKDRGYSFICPSSSSESWPNSDIKKVNALLDMIGIPKNQKIWLVGHSAGGGFAAKYAYASKRNVQAVHLVNSRAVPSILINKRWKYPTYFSYARCDTVVDYKKIEYNFEKLKSSKDGVLVDNVYRQRKDDRCHDFINVSQYFFAFKRKQRAVQFVESIRVNE